jgi:hypothetical protein
MGDIIEVACNEDGQVVRFFPREAQVTAPPATPTVSLAEQEQQLALKRPAYSEKEIEIFGQKYQVWMRHGFVMSANTTTTQSISTAYQLTGNGWVPDVQSHEYTTSEIRLLQQGGKKSDFDLGQKYTVHTGDEVTLVYIARKEAESGWLMGIQNHTTGRWNDQKTIYEPYGEANKRLGFFSKSAFLTPFFWCLGVSVILPLIFARETLGVVPVLGLVVGLVVGTSMEKSTNNKRIADVSEVFKKVLSDFS